MELTVYSAETHKIIELLFKKKTIFLNSFITLAFHNLIVPGVKHYFILWLSG